MRSRQWGVVRKALNITKAPSTDAPTPVSLGMTDALSPGSLQHPPLTALDSILRLRARSFSVCMNALGTDARKWESNAPFYHCFSLYVSSICDLGGVTAGKVLKSDDKLKLEPHPESAAPLF